jgi:cell wall-associated NlpC family hydrolase
VCCVPVSALRKEPKHTAEMVSQQLFGECCIVLESIPGWIKIRCTYDVYEGWCQSSHVVYINENQCLYKKEKLTEDYLTSVNYNGQKMFVPFGSSISTFKKRKALWQNNKCTFKGGIYIPSEEEISKDNIRWITAKYLNTPYLWGGKSVFGIDCSGFTQAVYKFLNIKLPRDSWQQAEAGDTIDTLQHSQCGDLCFFSNEEGKIVHVGILLDRHKIIHSSGKVRTDKIDEKGIINSDTFERTHSLKIIKRYFKI